MKHARAALLLVSSALLGMAACNNNETAATGDEAGASDGSTGFGIGPVLSATARSAREDDRTALVVELSLSPVAQHAVNVDFSTVDGTAVDGEDYQRAKGRLTFKPGESRKAIRIPLIDNYGREDVEEFVLRLHSSDDVTLRENEITLTITDDD